MPLETYRGTTIPPLLARAQADFGPDAMIVDVCRIPHWDGTGSFELLAGPAGEVTAVRRPHLTLGTASDLTGMSPDPKTLRRRGAKRPALIAVVGPTGVGKTTTIAKLMVNPRVFGRRKVGVLSLDTYRVGAVEQLRTYTELARVAFQVAYTASEVEPGLARLATCEVVLVDTPGWGPHNRESRDTITRWLRRLRPDEMHLALPIGMRDRLAQHTLADYEPLGVTHLLPTKLDELPDEWGIFDLAAACRFPMRWAADGQQVPTDLRPAGPRLLASLATCRTDAVSVK